MLSLLLLAVLAVKGSTGAGIPVLQLGSNFAIISHSDDSVVDCGGALFKEGTFTTPQYPSPYPNRQVCTWTLTAPEGQLIRLVFTNFAVEHGVQCSYDSVKIYNGPIAVTRNPVKTLCGTKPLIEHVGTKVVTVVFTSNDKIRETGFTAFFHSIPDATLPVRHDQGQTTCGGDYQGAFGTVASPNYPDFYPSNSNCSYTITVPYGNVQLEFLHLDIEYHHSCQRDYLEIREENSSGKLLRTVCGSTKSSRSISSTTRSLHLHFVSDSSLQGTGFYAAWKNDIAPQTTSPEVAKTTTPPTTSPEVPETTTAPEVPETNTDLKVLETTTTTLEVPETTTTTPEVLETTTTTLEVPETTTTTEVPKQEPKSCGQCTLSDETFMIVPGSNCRSFTMSYDGFQDVHYCTTKMSFDARSCACEKQGTFVCTC